MRKLTLIITAILLIFSFAGCDVLEWESYSSRENYFSIAFPRKWEKKDGVGKAVVTVVAPSGVDGGDRANTNMMVTVTELPQDIPLETYFDANKEELLSILPKTSNITEGQVLSGVLRGRWIALSTELDRRPLHIISCVWIRKQRAYVLSCVTSVDDFPQYEPFFFKAMKSMRIR